MAAQKKQRPLIRYAGSAAETSIGSKPIGSELDARVYPEWPVCQAGMALAQARAYLPALRQTAEPKARKFTVILCYVALFGLAHTGYQIPLPPLTEQHAIVSRLDTLADKARQVNEHLDAIERDADRLLAVRFRDAIADAPMRSMADVAPSVRRSVTIDIDRRYREVGARSFGKGLFVKPDFDGADATWQKPVWINAGDVVLSNIKAWEGAIAVAGDEHDGCIASHRYITCVPDPSMLTAGFLTYFLLSPEGLEQIGFASPGTADRNRTLSLTNLGKIEMPLPPIATQRAFDALQAKVTELKAHHATIRQANDALIPATLERVFSGAD